MYDDLRAEKFAEADLPLETAVVGNVPRERGVLEMFGADADDHVPARERLESCRQVAFRAVYGQVLPSTERDREPSVHRLERPFEEIHTRAADEACDEQVRRACVELGGVCDLLELAEAHDGDAVAERHRLDLIVRDVDRRDSDLLVEESDLRSHLGSQFRVEVRKRLVHEERLRLADERSTHRHALPLTAGELPRLAIELLVQFEDGCDAGNALLDLRTAEPTKLQREGQVLEDGLVRVESVVLEHHRDIPIAWRKPVDHLVADADLAVRDLFEPGNHAERCCLPAAGRTDEHHQLAVRNLERQVDHGDRAIRVDLLDVLERDSGHAVSNLYDGVPRVHAACCMT